jgi:hypothetical protein
MAIRAPSSQRMFQSEIFRRSIAAGADVEQRSAECDCNNLLSCDRRRRRFVSG